MSAMEEALRRHDAAAISNTDHLKVPLSSSLSTTFAAVRPMCAPSNNGVPI